MKAKKRQLRKKGDDSAGDSMNRKKLAKLKKELLDMRRSPQGRRSEDFQSYARSLGRNPENRGKEPTWSRGREPHLSPPLSIPDHSGEMKTNTARSIIDQLLADCDEWEIYLLEGDEDDK